MCLVAHHGGAANAVRLADFAAASHVGREALTSHVALYQKELMRLTKLLPFAANATAKDVASYAPVLLQLHKLTQRARGSASSN